MCHKFTRAPDLISINRKNYPKNLFFSHLGRVPFIRLPDTMFTLYIGNTTVLYIMLVFGELYFLGK